MAEKLDYKKEYKDLYSPKDKPSFIKVPPIAFFLVDGHGDPNGADYQNAVGVLYALTFTVKMSKMSGRQPEGYFEYVVPPLEGLWDCNDGAFDLHRRDAWCWTSMIRQPEFVTPEVFAWALQEAAAKKPALDFSGARFETFDEGPCVQMLHTGPFSTEHETVGKIEQFIAAHHWRDDCGGGRRHHEIYLSDPRKCAPEKMKTVLRHPVRL